MTVAETRQVLQVVLRDGGMGSVNNFKSLEEGTVIQLAIKPRSDAEIHLIANFGGLYTGEGCPQSHKDCCIMFQVLDVRCPENLIPWLKRSYFSWEGHQFRHLDDFHSICILDSVTIGAEAVKKLYQERNIFKDRLAKVDEVAQTLKNIL